MTAFRKYFNLILVTAVFAALVMLFKFGVVEPAYTPISENPCRYGEMFRPVSCLKNWVYGGLILAWVITLFIASRKKTPATAKKAVCGKQSRYYQIEFWIDRESNPFTMEMKQKLLDLLFNEFNGTFTPERYNSFEPVNKTFTDQEELSQLWDDECFFLKKISQPKMNFDFYRHNAPLLDHSIYRFIFDVGKKVDPGTVEFFLKRMIEITHPCFCFATSDTHWDARCRVKYVHVQGTTEHHIKLNDKRLCGVFWRTYFSNDLVKECKWQEKINNLPCECDSLTEGFLLKIYEDCFSPDWEKEDAVINHLGREYIADIKTFYKENNLIPVEEKV
jgi:hypothetical protein